MTIPDYQTIMLPLLRHLSAQKEHSMKHVVAALAKEFKLTKEDLTD